MDDHTGSCLLEGPAVDGLVEVEILECPTVAGSE